MLKFLSAVYVINDLLSIKIPEVLNKFIPDTTRIIKLNDEFEVEIFKVQEKKYSYQYKIKGDCLVNFTKDSTDELYLEISLNIETLFDSKLGIEFINEILSDYYLSKLYGGLELMIFSYDDENFKPDNYDLEGTLFIKNYFNNNNDGVDFRKIDQDLNEISNKCKVDFNIIKPEDSDDLFRENIILYFKGFNLMDSLNSVQKISSKKLAKIEETIKCEKEITKKNITDDKYIFNDDNLVLKKQNLEGCEEHEVWNKIKEFLQEDMQTVYLFSSGISRKYGDFVVTFQLSLKEFLSESKEEKKIEVNDFECKIVLNLEGDPDFENYYLSQIDNDEMLVNVCTSPDNIKLVDFGHANFETTRYLYLMDGRVLQKLASGKIQGKLKSFLQNAMLYHTTFFERVKPNYIKVLNNLLTSVNSNVANTYFNLKMPISDNLAEMIMSSKLNLSISISLFQSLIANFWLQYSCFTWIQ